MSRIGAFFDMDHTLIAGNSGYLYLKFLRREGRVALFELLQSLWWLTQYRLNLIDMKTVARRAFAKMAGSDEGELRLRNQEWFDAMVKPVIYREAALLVAQHRAQGHLTAIVTASTTYAATPLARHLGIDQVICTDLGIRDGRFTGSVHEPFCYGEGKAHWVRRLCEREGVDLSRSYFYTDSFSDLPLLEAVGERVVVNPDYKLRRVAKTRGWKILRFRDPRGA
jgi:HAD superfamily hydrolase (TIGR01490 family)